MKIQQATPKDHLVLTELTKKSKAYWNYSEQQLLEWDEELTITAQDIEEDEVYMLVEEDGKIIAYYSYYQDDEYTITLENLFVLPDYIDKGYGTLLINDLFKRLENEIIDIILVVADPNTEHFYKKMGFFKIGELESSIQGRFLPLMKTKLDKHWHKH